MLFQPAQGGVEVLPHLVGEAVHHLHRLGGLGSPLLLAIVKVPLVTESNDTLLTRPGDDHLLRLHVGGRVPRGHQHLLDQRLGDLHLLPLVLPHQHRALIEALQVDQLLSFGQLVPVVLTLDFKLVNHSNSTQVSKARDIDDRNRLEGQNHLISDPILLPERLLVGKISQGRPVVRRVTRNAGHYPSPLVLLDGQHGQRVDYWIGRERGGQGEAKNVLTCELCQDVFLAILWGEALVREVSGSSWRADPHFTF